MNWSIQSGGFIMGYNTLTKNKEETNFLERFYQNQAAKFGAKIPSSQNQTSTSQQSTSY